MSTDRTRTPRTLGGRVVRMAVVMVVAALALTGCDFSVYNLPLPGGADLGNNPYSVKIEFRDVLDLVPQSAVKVDDVTVGRVDTIKARGYHAEVTVLVRRDVKLPDNAEATIRQTSLLGEKFVSLAPPPVGASSNRLGNGDVIPLSASGRNPEVEEVLGALSLLLNGGGVAQLKTISTELNNALGGREPDVKSVLSQLNTFMGQLDTNKTQIVRAIESLNRLAVSLNKEQGTIKLALDDLPRAIASVNAQRDDLVKMLKSLADLSSVATHVISASKGATIDSLRALAPTLTKLAEAGSALPKALQVFLTYPFVDAVVGKNPAQARNLHMGDYTNLSAQLDIDASSGLPKPPSPTQVCKYVPAVGQKLCGDALSQVLKCVGNLQKGNVSGCTSGLLNTVCKNTPKQFPNLCNQPTPTPNALVQCFKSGHPNGAACSKVRAQTILYQCTHKKAKYYASDTCKRFRQLVPAGGGGLPNLPGGLTGSTGGGGLLGGLNRAPVGGTSTPSGMKGTAPDSSLAAMLTWGMVQR